jgi:superfamily II DNA/RNA helicase
VSPDVQVILLSATFEDHVMAFAKEVATDANIITLPIKEVTQSNVKQLYMEVRGEDGKFDALCIIYESVSIGQTIIFVNERRTALSVRREPCEEDEETGGTGMYGKGAQQFTCTF